MKASINLGFTQNLVLTPQLQQSIKLLQLSANELEQELINLTEANPFLEFDSEMSAAPLEPLPYLSNLSSSSSKVNISDDENDPINQVAQKTSLFDHLLDQIKLFRLSPEEKALIASLAGNLDEKGYLRLSMDELIEEVAFYLDPENGSPTQQIQRAISYLQQLDPVGVGARDLAECLQIQLKQFSASLKDTPTWAHGTRIVTELLLELSNQDYSQIKKILRINDAELGQALKLIRSFKHNPVEHLETTSDPLLTPDIVIKKSQGKWQALPNPAAFPKISLHQEYSKIIEASKKSSVSEGIAQKLQEARWLVKNIVQRNETILQVANEIVKMQQNFFEYGPIGMRPMVLREIAERLELHESTISRVTTQKYLTCLQGTFEFKYFFGSQVQTETGGTVSSTAIRTLIAQMVGAENPKKPLSDSKIVQLMADQGFIVARRTIAKYRDSLKILPVHLRKANALVEMA